MSNQTQSSALLVAIIAGVVGVVAFFALLVIGELAVLGALVLAVLLAILVAIFLLIAFRNPNEAGPVTAPKPAAEPALKAASAAPAAKPAPAPKPKAAPKPAPEPAPAAAPADGGTRPTALDGPRGGKADDLKKIKGVGPKLEKTCNSLGFYHFDQIAAWTATEVAWVDENLEGFKGRVTRDDWVAQAKLLAEGGETAFSKKVDKGDVY